MLKLYFNTIENLLVNFTGIYIAIYYEVRHDRTKREQNHAIELITRKFAMCVFCFVFLL